jgi:cytochrome c553
MNSKSMSLIAGFLSAISLASAHAQQQDVRQKVITVCAKCHGVDGNSVQTKYPKLAGQAKEYLLAQLKAFREKSRKDPDTHFMEGMGELLNDGLALELAEFFSAQKPARGKPGDAQLAAKGKLIYERGVTSKNVPACAFCHAHQAQGTNVIPRLAGQHAEYLVAQLKGSHLSYRPGLAVTMKAVVEKLSDEEAEQVAAYLQGL